MNKKVLILPVALIFTIIFVLLFTSKDKSNQNSPSTQNKDEKIVEVTDIEQINKIRDEAYLNTLLQIMTFDSLNVSHESLLEAAMRLAGNFNLYQTDEEKSYMAYVPKSTVHELIYELSGVRINNPIIIDDFYYLYDSNKDYYYIIPSGSVWLDLTNISSVHYSASSDNYIIKCSAESISDYGIKTTYPEVEIRLKYKASNTYLKYQLVSIHVGKSEVEFISPENSDYEYIDYFENDEEYDF